MLFRSVLFEMNGVLVNSLPAPAIADDYWCMGLRLLHPLTVEFLRHDSRVLGLFRTNVLLPPYDFFFPSSVRQLTDIITKTYYLIYLLQQRIVDAAIATGVFLLGVRFSSHMSHVRCILIECNDIIF